MVFAKRLGVVVLLVLLACPCFFQMQAWADMAGEPVEPDPVAAELERILLEHSLPVTTGTLDFKALDVFYRKRDYRPAWCDASGIRFNTQRWLAMPGRASQQSAVAGQSHLREIQHLLNAAAPRECAELDMLLTTSFLSHVRSLLEAGKKPSGADGERDFVPVPIEPGEVLEQALQSGQFAEVLAGLEPQHAGYQRLRVQLAHYRDIHVRGGWPAFAAAGERLEPKTESREIPILRQLLNVTGDLPSEQSDDTAGRRYDAALEQAVRRFQERHGLTVDGIIGRATRAALAVPVEQRIAQLRINLQRWHWLPHDLGERHIVVNTAAFQLQVHDGQRVPLSMRVIVGTPERETPVFTEQLRYLVVNPYWRVPEKIATEDLIPALLEDRSYFERKGIRVLSGWGDDAVEVDSAQVAWQDYVGKRDLPYHLRQDPGPDNSLGRIKFMLPNRHSIYLHDTPARSLFERPERAFSSGCIRVENPLALARYVLGGGEETAWILDAMLAYGDTRTVMLPEPIPVYLLYHTAWVSEDGKVHFRKDIYQRDRPLLAALRPLETLPQTGESAGKLSKIEHFNQLQHQN
ncbi:MAG: L,D-transpeptidase family protein [Thiogranum sp.]|nr:L,D-transpeptidase family protein [Thiogranum sp.]